MGLDHHENTWPQHNLHRELCDVCSYEIMCSIIQPMCFECPKHVIHNILAHPHPLPTQSVKSTLPGGSHLFSQKDDACGHSCPIAVKLSLEQCREIRRYTNILNQPTTPSRNISNAQRWTLCTLKAPMTTYTGSLLFRNKHDKRLLPHMWAFHGLFARYPSNRPSIFVHATAPSECGTCGTICHSNASQGSLLATISKYQMKHSSRHAITKYRVHLALRGTGIHTSRPRPCKPRLMHGNHERMYLASG